MFGSVVGTQNFFPFGETRSGTGIFDTDRGFTGQIFDAGTGLGFYNARYYDTALGKFISPDSIVPNAFNTSDFNRFSYVRNNPLRYIDPSGNEVRCVWVGPILRCTIEQDGGILPVFGLDEDLMKAGEQIGEAVEDAASEI